jgi:hypothetical protein
MRVEQFPRSERARRLRHQAEELQDRAVQARSPEVRLSYLELARSWQETAERVEGRDEVAAPVAWKPPNLTH